MPITLLLSAIMVRTRDLDDEVRVCDYVNDLEVNFSECQEKYRNGKFVKILKAFV